MRFFIVDDDEAIRSMLAEIIEDYDLGEVVGEAENGAAVDGKLLTIKAVDILLIDLLMPIRDGIQTVRELTPTFHGKIIMLSQVEDKEMIGNAYSLGVHYYITKPINRLEVISIIQNVTEHIRLQNVICNIEKNLNVLSSEKIIHSNTAPVSPTKNVVNTSGQYLLAELGMIGESGSNDLLGMLDFLYQYESEHPLEHEVPSLKEIFTSVAIKKLGVEISDLNDIKKESKAMEQRVRRTIFQGLTHLASLGVTDYTNPSFEEYAPKFFDFTEVRKIMLNLQNNSKPSIGNTHINIKKFVRVLFLESKKRH
ncbi:DNA-binding domain-containing protein [Pelosinus sp. UFO1]|uniref:DNA-binding domain-containing protein n=1 Tax=Pelosinus sp. UFO1 TaxID=484770 RepID=UPI0004D1E9E7|nr:DNA-binding domain-containing protein [Pelosinus sp. UFO1]AIF50597.1 response regulator receiver protein [Pelosinus sp. UFO1]